MNNSVTTSDVANDPSVSTDCQLRRPTNSIGPNRSQRCKDSHSTTSIGSSMNVTTPKRLGASKP